MKSQARANRRKTSEAKAIKKAFKENKSEKRKSVSGEYKRKSKHKLEY